MAAEAPQESDAGRVANQIAHELGTALALISGYADSLRDALGSDAAEKEVADSLEGIERGVARLRGISDQLAVWARAQRSDRGVR
jgi:signal transduction histidine kinase